MSLERSYFILKNNTGHKLITQNIDTLIFNSQGTIRIKSV